MSEQRDVKFTGPLAREAALKAATEELAMKSGGGVLGACHLPKHGGHLIGEHVTKAWCESHGGEWFSGSASGGFAPLLWFPVHTPPAPVPPPVPVPPVPPVPTPTPTPTPTPSPSPAPGSSAPGPGAGAGAGAAPTGGM